MKLEDRVFKILLCISFAALTLVIINLYNTPIGGYEPSIYESYTYQIIVLILILIYSTFVIEYFVLFNVKQSNILNYHFILLLFTYGIFLIFPQIINCAFYGRADICTHLGYIVDILKYGYATTIYPIDKILIAITCLFTRISERTLIQYIGPFFSIFCLISIYLLACLLFQSKRKAIYISSLSIFVCVGIAATPNRLAELTVPIFIYVYLKSKFERNTSYIFITLIMALLFPYFHPITCLILILSLVFSEILFNNPRVKDSLQLDQKFTLSRIPLILTISFLLWLWHNYWFWNSNFGRVIRWFIGEISISGDRTKEVLDMFAEYHLSLYEMLLKMYGLHIGYIIICIITIIAIYQQVLSHQKRNISLESAKLFILSAWIFIPFGMTIAFVMLPSFASPERMLRYLAILSVFYVGFSFLNLQNRGFKQASIFFIIILTVSSTMAIYPSPYVHLPTEQITAREITGMKWLFNSKSNNTEIMHLFERHFKFAEMTLGIKQTLQRNLDGNYYDQEVPDHFGYDIYPRIGDHIDKNEYIVTGIYDKYIYVSMFPDLNNFNSKDFDNIEYYDSSADKIYSNGELITFQINHGNDPDKKREEWS